MLNKPKKVRALAPTPRQMELYALLDGRGDVPIPELYGGYYGRDPKVKGHTTISKMQAMLGWPISSLNSRLRFTNERIVPGEARRTYRLTTIR
jgi:hypothetical protein